MRVGSRGVKLRPWMQASFLASVTSGTLTFAFDFLAGITGCPDVATAAIFDYGLNLYLFLLALLIFMRRTQR